MTRSLRLLLLPALLLLLAPAAQALPVSVEIGMMGNTDPLTDDDVDCSYDSGAGTYACAATGTLTGTNWMVSALSMTLDPDPFVQNFVAITNTSTTTQSFTVSVVLPVNVAFGPPSRIQGSIGGSLTDANGSGFAQLGFAGSNPLYQALIDGTPVRNLNSSVPLNVTNSFGTVGIPADNFGIPTFETVNVGLSQNIAITLRFSLTAGDTASFTSVFNVVPEPASAALLGLGLLTLVGAARRRARP